MAGGVTDGQPVDQATTNPAFLYSNGDDTATGKISLANTEPASGSTITNIQAAVNRNLNSTGATESTDGTDYSSEKVITDGDNHETALGKLDERFSETTGHSHDGTAGEGPQVQGANLDGVPLRGHVIQGIDYVGVTGTSTDVSSLLSGKSPSTNSTTKGVVVNAPENKTVLRSIATGFEDDPIVDSDGDVVFGRVTEAASVWTHSYYVNKSGIETAHNFTASQDIRWYYQELFNPVDDAPVYSEFANIPSDNVTASVIDATETEKGKVQLASTAAADVGSTGSKGTSNATVANADHVHRGVASMEEFVEAVATHGAIQLEAGTNISIIRTGNKFTFTASGVSALPAGVSMPFAGSVIPSGFLPCDGAAVSRTTYASLFAAIGTTWGAGDLSTTFNVPDLRGRGLIGDGTGPANYQGDTNPALTARTLGQALGRETHTLTTGELAQHNHGVTDTGHVHGPGASFSGYYKENPSTPNSLASGANLSRNLDLNTGSATTGITINNNGSSTPHNNMAPEAVIKWIIKT